MTFRLFGLVAASTVLVNTPVNLLSSAIASTSENFPIAQTQTTPVAQIAQAITVKVMVGTTWGSGILIRREGKNYTVLTNRHVLTPADSYRIQTSDGRIYNASVLRGIPWADNDLALLQFQSDGTVYAIATLAPFSHLKVGDTVLAAGFPAEDDLNASAAEFVFVSGQVRLVLESPLKEGYQIGYTGGLRKGMSGGPLLNQRGEVVGINGRHAYPIWGNPYQFKNGSVPSPALQQQMFELNWAIAVQTFVQLSGQAIAPPVAPSQMPSVENESIDPLPVAPLEY